MHQDASRSLLQLEVLSEEHELLCCLIRADGCFLVVEDPPLDLPKALIRIVENRVACWGYAGGHISTIIVAQVRRVRGHHR